MSSLSANKADDNTFRKLWGAGFRRLVPIVPPDAELSEHSTLYKRAQLGKSDGRGKSPGVCGDDGKWRGYDFVRHESSEAELDAWHAMGAGTGIKTGRGLIAIDIDTTDEAAAAQLLADVEAELGVAPKRYGRAPKVLLPFRIADDDTGTTDAISYDKVTFETVTEKDPKHPAIVELLSEGRQFVAWGVHPVTRQPYRWARPLVAYDKLPTVTAAQVRALFDHWHKTLPAAQRVSASTADRAAVDQAALRGKPDVVAAAVRALPNTSELFPGRPEFLNVGYAIKGALQDDPGTAFGLWCEWADRWPDGENDHELMAEDWRRMKPPYGLGAGYVYDMAEKHGGWRGRADAWFDVLPAANENAGTVAPERKRFELVPFRAATAQALADKARPLIKGLLDQGAMTVLYGDSNVGKTFVTVDMSYHIAEGLDYGGMPTTRMPVVYVAAEGGRAINKRLLALEQKHGPTDNFYLLKEPVNLREARADTGPLIEAIAALPEAPGLIVIDTLSRAIAGGEENNSVDMGSLVANFDRIRAATGAHLLVVHHTGKIIAKGARGHSLLRAATDTELEVQDGRIAATKQRDMDGTWSSGFRLEPRVVGLDVDGAPVTSCTVRLVDVAEVKVGVPTAAEKDVLTAVEVIQATSPKGRDGVSVVDLVRYFADNMSTNMNGETIRSHLRTLAAKKLVDKSARGAWKVVSGDSVEAVDEPVDAETGCFA